MSGNAHSNTTSTHIVGRPFARGRSGNPSGRPKGIEALAREHTPAAIAALVKALDSPKERVPAAVALLNRGWGLPKQTIETDAVSSVMLHLLAAQTVSAELSALAVDAVTARTIDAEPVDQANLLDAPPPTE